MNTCYICECGWIIIGQFEAKRDNMVRLKDASVVRCWSNGRGIGAISKKEYKDEYILDEIGYVEIAESKIIFAIPCEW